MDVVDLVLWGLAAGLAAVATWLTLPRTPALDWQLHFKVTLVTLVRGQVEAEGGDARAWLEAGRARVWYHPAARGLADLLEHPDPAALPVPALPGERALMEELARRPDVAARLEALFSSGGDELLYDDPGALGPDYDPAPVLGPEAGWEAVATWEAPVAEGLRRRHERVRWAAVGAPPSLVRALAAVLGEERVSAVDHDTDEGLETSLEALVPRSEDRLVLLVSGAGALPMLRVLARHAGLRDRLVAVVGVAADLGGETAAWLSRHFTHQVFDTELHRATPWFHLAFAVKGCLPPGEPGLPLRYTAWPHRDTPASGRRAMDPVDLGLLPGPSANYPAELLARALLITVAARLARG